MDCLIFDGAEGIREQADLQQLAAPYVKRQVTLKELHVLAERIHQYYAAQGLFVAKAVVPVQTIEQGRVVMKIFYGRIGKVIVENKSRLLTERLPKSMPNWVSSSPRHRLASPLCPPSIYWISAV